MSGFFMAGMGTGLNMGSKSSGGGGKDVALTQRVRELEHQLQRVNLLNQALWELLRDNYGLSEEALTAKVEDVDLRDGVKDGRITDTAVACPQCGRVSNSKHYKCLYCGVKFRRPIMG